MGNFRQGGRGGFGGGNRRFGGDRGDRGDRGGRGGFGGGNRRFGGDRETQMFNTICSACNKECQVPFKPTGSKPVLCSDCFRNKDGGSSSRGSSNSQSSGISQDQFKQLNAKIDRIILILQQLEIDNGDDLDEEDADDLDNEEDLDEESADEHSESENDSKDSSDSDEDEEDFDSDQKPKQK